jgi:predicted amidohydrolase YtcJ
MVLLSDDIFTIAPENIRNVKVLKTIVGGKIVWDASAPQAASSN